MELAELTWSKRRILRSLDRDRRQYLAFLMVSLGAISIAALARHLGVTFFARFLGPRSPALAVACAALVGALLLALLVSHRWFDVRRRGDIRGPMRAIGVALAFGVVIVVADFWIVFPRDLNAPFPGSLLFYPAIAFIVEVVFHLAPLAVLLPLAVAVLGRERRDLALTACLGVVALFEPTFQATLDGLSPLPTWASVFVWIHVAAINLAQLSIFRRYDFVSMLTLRLAYYFIWHVVWGHYRLHVLF